MAIVRDPAVRIESDRAVIVDDRWRAVLRTGGVSFEWHDGRRWTDAGESAVPAYFADYAHEWHVRLSTVLWDIGR